MDLHWGQNITKCLEDPDSLLQPCEMPRRAVLFFFFFLRWTFKSSVPNLRRKTGRFTPKRKEKKAKCERIFLSFKVQHSSSQHGTEKKKSWNQIHLNVIVEGTLSLMLSHNPLRQISIKRVRVSDKTVSMYEQERVNGCYLGLVKSLLFSFFPPKNVFWFTFKICIFIFC